MNTLVKSNNNLRKVEIIEDDVNEIKTKTRRTMNEIETKTGDVLTIYNFDETNVPLNIEMKSTYTRLELNNDPYITLNQGDNRVNFNKNVGVDNLTSVNGTDPINVLNSVKCNETLLALKNLRIGEYAGQGVRFSHTDISVDNTVRELMGHIDNDTGEGEILMSSSNTSSKIYMGRVQNGQLNADATLSEINTYGTENNNVDTESTVVASLKVKTTTSLYSHYIRGGVAFQFFTQTLRNVDDLSILSNFDNPAVSIFRDEDNGRAVLNIDGTLESTEQAITITSTGSSNLSEGYILFLVDTSGSNTDVVINLPPNNSSGAYYKGKTITIKRLNQGATGKTKIVPHSSADLEDDATITEIQLNNNRDYVSLFFNQDNTTPYVVGGNGYIYV